MLSSSTADSKFEWSSLGNLEEGRQTLGHMMPVMVYRLLQYTLRDVLEREYRLETAAELLRASGHLAGVHFARNVLDLTGAFDHFIANCQRILCQLKIGILRIERADFDTNEFILTVSEDLDCSGLPLTGDTVCNYDEGFIAGLLEEYMKIPFAVREIDCWANGDRTCRFHIKPKAN